MQRPGPTPSERIRAARGTVAVLAVLAVLACVGAMSADAATAAVYCPTPVRDRYEPGDEVTVVGYTRGCVPAAVKTSTSSQRPLKGYLHRDPCDLLEPPDPDEPRSNICGAIRNEPPPDPTSGIPVGRFALEETAHTARGKRMSLTFRLPNGLAPGAYLVEVCQDPCVTDGNWARSGYGWPSPIYVGVDPPAGERPTRAWPLDDPAIDDLPDDVLVYGPDGQTITAAELRATSEPTESGTDENDENDRTETAATGPDDADHDGDGSSWLVAAGLLAMLLLVGSRLGAGRKRVRPRG